MALPVTIASVTLPRQNYFIGPFKAPNQAVYVILNRTGNSVSAWKAIDPTDSFTRQDDAGAPSTHTNAFSVWCYLSGSEIHVVSSDTVTPALLYHVFDTASDTWTTTDETIEDIKDVANLADLSCSIAVRSDGDKVVLYAGDQDNDMGNPYDRVDAAVKTGASWNVGIDVGGVSPAAENRRGSVLVRGSADNMHFFWTNSDVTNEFQARSMNSVDSLGAIRTSDEMTTPFVHTFGPGVAWDDAGTWRIAVPFYDNDTDELKISRWTETSGVINAIVGSTVVGPPQDVEILNATVIACACVDGDGRMYVMWSGGGAGPTTDRDLWRDDALTPFTSFAGETEVIDATTILKLSCNIYPRDGAIKLAFIYDEAGTIKYNEISISAPTAPTMANSRFPDQNYKIGPFSV